jgi:hypothetical protein
MVFNFLFWMRDGAGSELWDEAGERSALRVLEIEWKDCSGEETGHELG